MIDLLYFFYFKFYSMINKSQIYYFNKINQDLYVIINRKLNSLNYFLNMFFYRIANEIVKREFNPHKSRNIGINTFKRDKNIIVSLTSFPSRIDTIWICIESLLRQTLKPDEIVLWLADTQFNGLSSLPDRLIEQQKRGLTIRFCEDIKSHKKYYYAFKEYPDDIIITVDDDVIYPKDTIKALISLHKKYPECICCNFAVLITFNNNNEINPIRKWPGLFFNILKKPTYLLLPVGVSGILYPPKLINLEVFNKDIFKKICFYADDIWLKLMGLLNGTKVMQTSCFPGHFFTIQGSQKDCLLKTNITRNQNEVQFQAVLNRYRTDLMKFIKREPDA